MDANCVVLRFPNMRRLWFIFGVITYLCWLFVWISTTLSFGIRSGRGIETYLLVFRLEIIRKVKENRAERRERKGEWEGWFISSRWSGQSVLVTSISSSERLKTPKRPKRQRQKEKQLMSDLCVRCLLTLCPSYSSRALSLSLVSIALNYSI